jgi:hypothetical protein
LPPARWKPGALQAPPGHSTSVTLHHFPTRFNKGPGIFPGPPDPRIVVAGSSRRQYRSAALACMAAIRSRMRADAAAGVSAECRFNMALTSEWPPSAHFFPPRRLRPCESSQRHNARGPIAGFWAASIKNQIVYCSAGSGINFIGSYPLGLQPKGQRSGRVLRGTVRRPIQYAHPLLAGRFRASRASRAATRWERPARVSAGSVTVNDSGRTLSEHGGSAKALGMIFFALSLRTEVHCGATREHRT